MSIAAAEYAKLAGHFAGREGIESGQMFGKPCLKIKGKAFIAQHLETMVFKLGGPASADALALKGAKHWDPSGMGRPMKEWIAVPVRASADFERLAAAAFDFVNASK